MEHTTLFALHKRTRSKPAIVVALFLLEGIGSFVSSSKAQISADTAKPLANIVMFAEAAGFIPFRESYRINYATSLGGIPIEISGGFCFPVNSFLSAMFDVRYKRRTAVYVPDLRIKTLEIELGVRDYLEKEHDKDLRLYGSAALLLARATTTGYIDATSDGKAPIPQEVSKDYFNIGLGLGLGVEYPLARISALYAGIHLGVYFADPISTGGLGNIGGLTVGLGYRVSLGE